MEASEILVRLAPLVIIEICDAPDTLLSMSCVEGLKLKATEDGFIITDPYRRFINVFEFMGVISYTLNDGICNMTSEAHDQAGIQAIYLEVLDHLTAAPAQ